MKDNKYIGWNECNFKMPFAIKGSFAVVNESNTAIHIIGGQDDDDDQDTHYVLYIVK